MLQRFSQEQIFDRNRPIDVPPVVPLVAAMATGLLIRNLAKGTWHTVYGENPPENPAARGVTWKQALLWGGCVGFAVGIARAAAKRSASVRYRALKRM